VNSADWQLATYIARTPHTPQTKAAQSRRSGSGQTARVKQLDLFNTSTRILGVPPAPKGREWMRSFLVPSQCPPETPPAIVGKRKTA
jgi:hypothetical protein